MALLFYRLNVLLEIYSQIYLNMVYQKIFF